MKTIKDKFKIFTKYPDLVYLDTAATALTFDSVVEQMNEYYYEKNAPVHRGIYDIAYNASTSYEGARLNISNFFNCDVNEVIFTKSTTASLNNIAKSVNNIVKDGDEIIVTELEHHSNFLPWQVLASEKNATLQIIKAKNKTIEINDILQLITAKTKVVAVHHMSNVIGNIIDIKKLCEQIREKNKDVIIVVDGAQASAHLKVDFKQLNCDVYTISAHKMYGPTGLGVLLLNKRLHNLLNPFEYGGDMVVPSSVDTDTYMVKDAPLKFEAGTPSIAEVLGFSKALDELNEIGMENIEKHEKELKLYFKQKYEEIKDMVDVYNLENNSGLITFNIKNVAVHDAVSESPFSDQTFNKYHIALRDGQMCNNLTMKYVLGQKAVLRASLGIYTCKDDIDKLIEVIKKIYLFWN